MREIGNETLGMREGGKRGMTGMRGMREGEQSGMKGIRGGIMFKSLK